MYKKTLTLAELILALAVLAVTIGTFLISLISCLRLNDTNRNLALATNHAQYVLEDIRSQAFVNIASRINNDEWDWDSGEIAATGLTALPDEDINTSVAVTAGGVAGDLLTITVNAFWKDKGKKNRNIVIQTLLVEP